MANNGIFYTSGNTLDFTTTGTTWARLSSGGTFSSLGLSATTYYNLPPLYQLTGGTYSTGTIDFKNTTGGTSFSVSGLSKYFVTGSTPSGITLVNGDRWFDTTSAVELVWVNDGDSSQWIQPFSLPGPISPDGYFLTNNITTSQTLTWNSTYWGISGSSNVNLTLPSTTAKDGYYIIIKDEAGTCGTYRIRITPSSGLIDGNNYVDMNINYMSLTCMVRGGNWYLI